MVTGSCEGSRQGEDRLMGNEILAFAVGFGVCYAFSVMRIGVFKNRIKLYERYVQHRLDESVDNLRSGLISR